MCISHRCVRVMMFLIVFRASKLMELMEWCVILITLFYPIGIGCHVTAEFYIKGLFSKGIEYASKKTGCAKGSYHVIERVAK